MSQELQLKMINLDGDVFIAGVEHVVDADYVKLHNPMAPIPQVNRQTGEQGLGLAPFPPFTERNKVFKVSKELIKWSCADVEAQLLDFYRNEVSPIDLPSQSIIT